MRVLGSCDHQLQLYNKNDEMRESTNRAVHGVHVTRRDMRQAIGHKLPRLTEGGLQSIVDSP